MTVERKKVPPEFQKPDTRSELKVVFTFIFDL